MNTGLMSTEEGHIPLICEKMMRYTFLVTEEEIFFLEEMILFPFCSSFSFSFLWFPLSSELLYTSLFFLKILMLISVKAKETELGHEREV